MSGYHNIIHQPFDRCNSTRLLW